MQSYYRLVQRDPCNRYFILYPLLACCCHSTHEYPKHILSAVQELQEG